MNEKAPIVGRWLGESRLLRRRANDDYCPCVECTVCVLHGRALKNTEQRLIDSLLNWL